jgi:hypothetical protein
MPTDLLEVTRFLDAAVRSPEGVIGSVLPSPLARGTVVHWSKVLPGLFGLRSRLRVYLEEYRGRMRAAALVHSGHRPEWAILLLAAQPGPEGPDAAFRLISGLSAEAARRGMHRLFGAVPDETRARETFFQAGFYSYTRETWYVRASAALPEPKRRIDGQLASGRDAHDLFRFYTLTTPHAVQRAEQLSVEDFDVGRRAGAFDPPHLVGGNPLAMRREVAIIVRDEHRPRAFAVSFRGIEQHPHVCKVRTADGDVELARELVRAASLDLAPGRPLTAPVRSYEEHVARALVLEGFEETATAMLFVKELAVRIEEPALAPAVVR